MSGVRIAKEERDREGISGPYILELGTLIYANDNIAKVKWDSGDGEEFDLRLPKEETRLGSFFLLDNSPAGVLHEGVECHACHALPLPGIRWQCHKGYNLCTKCYMGDAPSTNHSFNRMLTPSSLSNLVGRRAGCEKTQAIGIAVDVKVDDQSAETARSGVSYYKDHLIRLKEMIVIQETSDIRAGDKAYTLLDKDTLSDILNGAPQEDKAHISQVFGKVGVVQEVTISKQLVVNYGNFQCKWPDFVFTKVPRIFKGDSVFVIENENVVKRLLDGHGGWRESMKRILGRECKVMDIDEDDDVDIESDNEKFLVNPLCLFKKEGRTQPQGPWMPQNACFSEKMEEIDEIDRQFLNMTQSTPETDVDRFVQAVSKGELNRYLEDIPNILFCQQINCPSEGHTALHVATHFGYLQDVELLLIHGADTQIKQVPNGYTALHLAARRDQTGDVAHTLLQYGANPNKNDNKEGVSPLHLAVAYQKINTLNVLLRHAECDVNVQNKQKETPLHIAVKNGVDERILDSLLKKRNINCSLSNDRGYNPLQLAALLGNTRAVKSILQRAPHLLMQQKKNGFSPLHLAAYENNKGVAEILVEQKCDVNATTNEKCTALHLAVCQGHVSMMTYLRKVGARSDIKDADGDTAVTMALLQRVVSVNSWKYYSEEMKTGPKLCKYCEKKPPQAFFKPCGHKIACTECAREQTTGECKECKQGVRRSIYPDDFDQDPTCS